MYIPQVLIQSPVEGLVGCLWFGTIMSMLLQMFSYTWLFLHIGIFLLGIYIGLALPGQRMCKSSTKAGSKPNCFPKQLYKIHSYPAHENSLFSSPNQHLLLSVYKFQPSGGHVLVSRGGFNLHFLMISQEANTLSHVISPQCYGLNVYVPLKFMC